MTENTSGELKTLNIQDIMRYLPHRYPFLLVDRIEKVDANRSAVGFKNVTANEPHFQGHFPGQPIMPGVLIIEGMAQTAGAISIMNEGGDAPSHVYFMTIDKAKFRRPVVPGDVLEYHVKLVKQRGSISRYECVAMVGAEKVAEAEVQAMMSPPDAEG